MQLIGLQTKWLGRHVLSYHNIDSSQLEIYRQIEKGEMENGTLVVASIQTEAMRNARKKVVYQ